MRQHHLSSSSIWFKHFSSSSLLGLLTELAMRQCFGFATTTTWEHVRASETSKNMTKVKAFVSKWICHKECTHTAISYNFWAWKHCHVVAYMPSSAIFTSFSTVECWCLCCRCRLSWKVYSSPPGPCRRRLVLPSGWSWAGPPSCCSPPSPSSRGWWPVQLKGQFENINSYSRWA